MQRFFQRWFWWMARCFLRLRYRVQVQGGERLQELVGPTIVMPNHPGYIDPALVLTHVRLRDPLRPLVYTGTYRNPVLYPIMRAIGSVEVPELSAQSRQAKQTTLDMIERVAAAVGRGESILIYPSGRLQREGFEVVGASRAAAELLRACPEANIVLVRTRGVWGSMFSWGRTAAAPHLGSCIVRGLLWALANLLFFLPRRQVTMMIEIVPRGELPDATREQLNPYLEEWYNRDGRETPTFVRYHFLSTRRNYEFPQFQRQLDIDFDKIRPATRSAVDEMVEEHLRRPLTDEERVALTTLDRLGLDSLDRMDLALEIEQRFGFRSDRVAATLGELWALAEGLLTGDGGTGSAVPPLWTRAHTGGEEPAFLADTMAEAFVRRVRANPDDVAVADRLSGVLTYRRMLVGASLMAKRFTRFEGDAVGVLLPSTVAADVVFFALHLAGKLPVMLNWTTGPANLAHAVQTMKIRHVVTSHRFVDRLGVEIEGAEYVFLEDLRAGIGRLEAAVTLARTYVSIGSFLKNTPRASEDDAAVVLFTSGSEAAPKAVPLSHRNLRADIQAGIQAMGFTRQDVLLGFLPPFHSFGLAGNLVCPVLTGIRVAHHPDPTDARGLVQTVAQYGVSLLFTTPTFLGYMLARATPEDFRTFRIVVTGAEKCPDVVRETCAKLAPHAFVLEGYGITECSPVVSVGRPGNDKPGTVGQPLAGVEACVVDPDSHAPLPIGQTGLLLVAGPTIFRGYLNHTGPDPFVELNGVRWYNTGDLAALDEDRFIHFRGRLKRFIKAGGEMISLPALEEPLTRRYPPTEEGPRVAVEGIETPDGRRIVLFSTQPIALKDANAVLAEAGFRGVMRLDETRQIDKIPVLGTGKTDYKVLRKLIADA
ncbi:MAG: AMP-binding protein [Pirellulaceae bacterium]|nr:AMP-binding protein [Pirellulaceae bacterium]